MYGIVPLCSGEQQLHVAPRCRCCSRQTHPQTDAHTHRCTHAQTHHGLFSAEQRLRQGLCQLRLAHACRGAAQHALNKSTPQRRGALSDNTLHYLASSVVATPPQLLHSLQLPQPLCTPPHGCARRISSVGSALAACLHAHTTLTHSEGAARGVLGRCGTALATVQYGTCNTPRSALFEDQAMRRAWVCVRHAPRRVCVRYALHRVRVWYALRRVCVWYSFCRVCVVRPLQGLCLVHLLLQPPPLQGASATAHQKHACMATAQGQSAHGAPCRRPRQRRARRRHGAHVAHARTQDKRRPHAHARTSLAQEEEGGDGTVGVLHAGPAALDGLRHSHHRLVLAHNAPVELVRQVQHLRGARGVHEAQRIG